MSSFLRILVFAILLPPMASKVADPLFYYRTNPEKYVLRDLYEDGLVSLHLDDTSQSVHGVHSQSLRQYKSFALTSCCGEISSSQCGRCVFATIIEILKLCPYNKGAVIWYNDFSLKYDYLDFTRTIDWANEFYVWSKNAAVSYPAVFNEKTKWILNELAEKASKASNFFAEGQTKAEGYSSSGRTATLYGMVQCMRDLSPGDCKQCLDGIIDELLKCSEGREGGRIGCRSCGFRYEIYPFPTV